MRSRTLQYCTLCFVRWTVWPTLDTAQEEIKTAHLTVDMVLARWKAKISKTRGGDRRVEDLSVWDNGSISVIDFSFWTNSQTQLKTNKEQSITVAATDLKPPGACLIVADHHCRLSNLGAGPLGFSGSGHNQVNWRLRRVTLDEDGRDERSQSEIFVVVVVVFVTAAAAAAALSWAKRDDSYGGK